MTPLQLSQDFEARLAEEQLGLRRFLRRVAGPAIGRDPSALDDALQESLTRALRSRERFDPDRGSLGAWLRTIGLRVWIDAMRARSRVPEGLGDSDGGVVDPGTEATVGGGSRGELEDGLRALRVIERRVLIGFHVDGLSIEDLSGSLGLREGTVKSHLHRARKRLAEIWSSRDQGPRHRGPSRARKDGMG